MIIRLLFFGATADIVGKREIELNFEKALSVGEALQDISADHPALHDHSLLFSVNEEYVATDRLLNDGDELAIFTPVSGG